MSNCKKPEYITVILSKKKTVNGVVITDQSVKNIRLTEEQKNKLIAPNEYEYEYIGFRSSTGDIIGKKLF